MTFDTPDSVYAAWTRLGFGFSVAPSDETPDLERLLLATARFSPDHPRLFLGAVNWVARWWTAVARLRLRQLIQEELEEPHRPVLAALIEEAARLSGGHKDLLDAISKCTPNKKAHPLFVVERGCASLVSAVEKGSSPAGKKWGCWFDPVEKKEDVLFAKNRVLHQNPTLIERTVRRGDLRASILESFRFDRKEFPSETALAAHLSASRIAVRKSLDALEGEGITLRQPPLHGRKIRIAMA